MSFARMPVRIAAPTVSSWLRAMAFNVAVCELAIGGSSSTVAVATRHVR